MSPLLPPPLTVSCWWQVSERRLRPVPQKQRTLHEKILEEIKQERRLRPVGAQHLGARGEQVDRMHDGREDIPPGDLAGATDQNLGLFLALRAP